MIKASMPNGGVIINHFNGDQNVAFFKPMQLPIRSFIERRNCELRCPDDTATADDMNRFNEPERTTPIEHKGAYGVPMPAVGQSLWRFASHRSQT